VSLVNTIVLFASAPPLLLFLPAALLFFATAALCIFESSSLSSPIIQVVFSLGAAFLLAFSAALPCRILRAHLSRPAT